MKKILFLDAPWRLTVHERVKLEDPRNCRFQFQKCSQQFIRVYNETLSIAAVCIGNPDCSPVQINS
jgi:hypothetical protein